MKPIILSIHARDQMELRGTTDAEVETTISQGEKLPASVLSQNCLYEWPLQPLLQVKLGINQGICDSVH